MLPVLIAVSAVCLVEDAGKGNEGETDVVTYAVESDYAEDVTLQEKDGKWVLSKVPTRNYYSLSGIKVNGAVYPVKDGEVELADDKKETFEKDVKDKKSITTVWDCTYRYINISTFGYLAQDDVCMQDYYDVDTTLEELEEVGVFTKLQYQKFETESIETFVATIDTNENGEIDVDDTSYTLTFTIEDKTSTGDILLSTLLNKLAEQEVTVKPNSSGYAEIELAK